LSNETKPAGISEWRRGDYVVGTDRGRLDPELQGFRRWVLATRDAHGLYRQFGFAELKQPDRWMERHDPKTVEKADDWR